MAKNKWVVVTGVLLLAAVIAGFILFQQRNDARQRWQERREQIDRLKQQVAVLNESAQEQTDRLNVSAELIQQKQSQLDTVNQQLQQMKTRSNVLQNRLAALEERIVDLTRERDQLQAERHGLSTRLEALESDAADNSATIATLNKRAAGLKQRSIDLEKEIEALRSALADKNALLAASRNSCRALQSEVDRLHQDLRAAVASAEQLEARQRSMKQTYESLMTGLEKQLVSKEASIESYRQKLKVTFVDQILFGFSQVRLSPEGEDVLHQLADVLASVSNGRISIVGHTDNIPIAEKYRYRFPSNWELSSARAAAVARHLLKHGGIEPSKIEIIGRSRYQPLAPNDTEAGRAKNRRVEIIINPELSSD